MKNLIILTSLLGLSLPAAAVRLQEVDLENNRVALRLESGDFVSVGDRYLLNLSSGKQCAFAVTELNKNGVIAEIERCSEKNALLVGSRLSKSAFKANANTVRKKKVIVSQAAATTSTVSAPTPAVEKVSSELPTASFLRGQGRFGIFAFYSSASKMAFDGTITVDGDSVTASNDEISEAAPGIGLVYQQGGAGPMGFNLGVSYEFRRQLKSFETKIDGEDFSGPAEDNISFSLFNPFLNLMVAPTQRSYLFAGVNFPFFDFKGGEGDTDIKGKLGFQVGAGFDLASKVQLEVAYKVLKMQATSKEVIDFDFFGPVVAESDLKGEFAGFLANLKFVF